MALKSPIEIRHYYEVMRAKVNLTEHTNCKNFISIPFTSFVWENLKWERGWGDPELKKTLSKTLSFRCLRRKRLKEALSPCLS